MKAVDLDCERLKVAKRAFTTRRVSSENMRTLISGDVRPTSGDLVLATVEEIGKHRKIEKPSGRRALMMPGDEIVVCFGNRYAPDQFEALVPEDLSPCDLVAAGGIAANEICRHERMIAPTRIAPIGLIGDAFGKPLNLSQYAIDLQQPARRIATIVVVGTAMNSGKTYAAASLIHGFKSKGFKVAGIKATGTGAGGDLWQMKDMGADVVLDFSDAGLPSTYKVAPDRIEDVVHGLIDHAARCRCAIAVVEIADGLQHEETATLLRTSRLRHRSLGVFFAAYDSLGAIAGVKVLRQDGHKVLGVSGQITRSPLAMRESQDGVGCPVYTPHELQAGALFETLIQKQPRETISRPLPKQPVPAVVSMPLVQEDGLAHQATNDVADKIAIGA